MGLFDWLLDHGDDEREAAESKVLVPQRAHVEEAEVVIIPFGHLRPNELVDEDSSH